MISIRKFNHKNIIAVLPVILILSSKAIFANTDENLSYIQMIIDLAIDSLRYLLYTICGITAMFQLKDTRGEMSQAAVIFLEFYIKFACINGIEQLIRKIFQSGSMIFIG